MSYYFDIINLPKDPKMAHLSDLQLVRLAQKDVDNYRQECYWECVNTGLRISYLDSLLVMGRVYVHAARTADFPHKLKDIPKEKRKKRSRYMVLKRGDNKEFDSLYFNDLFARYHSRLVTESIKSANIDSPDEVYTYLIGAFSKIVNQFARDKKFDEKSEKWFSSFFWRSIQNKIADLQKTNNYAKRSPLVRCNVTGRLLGQITKKHLFKECYSVILDHILQKCGRQILINRGNISKYEDSPYIREQSLKKGRDFFDNQTNECQKNLFMRYCLEAYAELFPSAKFSNKVLSSNMYIGKEGDSTALEDLIGHDDQSNTIDQIDVSEKIEGLVNIILEEKEEELVRCFHSEDTDKAHDITKEIIEYYVYNFNEMENVDKVCKIIDKKYKEFCKRGASAEILGLLRTIPRCLSFIKNPAIRTPAEKEAVLL